MPHSSAKATPILMLLLVGSICAKSASRQAKEVKRNISKSNKLELVLAQFHSLLELSRFVGAWEICDVKGDECQLEFVLDGSGHSFNCSLFVNVDFGLDDRFSSRWFDGQLQIAESSLVGLITEYVEPGTTSNYDYSPISIQLDKGVIMLRSPELNMSVQVFPAKGEEDGPDYFVIRSGEVLLFALPVTNQTLTRPMTRPRQERNFVQMASTAVRWVSTAVMIGTVVWAVLNMLLNWIRERERTGAGKEKRE